MNEKRKLPSFGHWPSPISAASVAGGSLRFGRVQMANGCVFWSESRPAEGGRSPVMQWHPDHGLLELLPPPFSARSRVHEYGGGEFLAGGDTLYFVNDKDQDIYRCSLVSGDITRLTNMPDTRFADFAHDKSNGRLLAVGERHVPGLELPENFLIAVSTEGDAPATQGTVLCDTHDFYVSPRLSPDGMKLAYLAWRLPGMPWDDAALYVAEIASDGSLVNNRRIAGGNGSACFQPEWSADGSLYFVWDADGFGNLFQWKEGVPSQLTRHEGDLSLPQWSFNASTYALLTDDRVYLSYVEQGEHHSAIYDLRSGAVDIVANHFTDVQSVSSDGQHIATLALQDHEPRAVVLETAGPHGGAISAPKVLRRSSDATIDAAYISQRRPLKIPSTNGATAYGMFYPPANPQVNAASGKPPLIINMHGGPTSSAVPGLKPRTLFFTSRGFAWLDLDYAGSVGYGRAYRDRLKGQWGIADVDDTIAAANFAVTEGLADERAIFVTGGSAGGYTVLRTICETNLFRGAASYYGIGDLVALQKSTHKFEQGYQSTLLGATLEDGEALYRERSPLSHVARINTPVILFQGSEDRVVPREQAIEMASALKARGVLVQYHEFNGEGHGFRKGETIERTLELELAFYLELMSS